MCWIGLEPAFEVVEGFFWGSFLFFFFFLCGRIGMNGWIRAMDGWSQPASPMTDICNLLFTAFRSGPYYIHHGGLQAHISDLQRSVSIVDYKFTIRHFMYILNKAKPHCIL